MDFDVPIKVDLDSGQALAQIRSLEQKKTQATEKQNQFSRGRALVGAVVGFKAVRRVTTTYSDVDPWSVALTPYTAAIQQTIDNALGFNATARKQARTMTVAAFAETANNAGTEVAARQFYQAAQRLTSEQEAGRQILRQDPALAGPSLVELLAQALPGYFKLIGKSFDYLVGKFFG